MSIPMAPNTTCDIYHWGAAPPSPPSVAGVKCYLTPVGQSTLTTPQSYTGTQAGYTHKLYVDHTVDIRDGTGMASLSPNQPDSFYVPDKNGQQFQVVMVRRYGRGTATDYLIVLAKRLSATWPQQNL
jgi:hypothetical protein